MLLPINRIYQEICTVSEATMKYALIGGGASSFIPVHTLSWLYGSFRREIKLKWN